MYTKNMYCISATTLQRTEYVFIRTLVKNVLTNSLENFVGLKTARLQTIIWEHHL